MKVSIIIAVFVKTDKRYIETCVDSIRRNSKEKHEIIISINPAGSIEGYEHIDADKILFNEEQGQCHANNQMVKEVSNEWILVSDYDTIFPPGWEKVLSQLEEDAVTCANCMEWNERGSAPGFVNNNCGDIDTFELNRFEEDSLKMSEEKWTTGFCYPFLVEKKHFLAIEGYDEEYDPWGSNCDSDFQYKLMLLGLRMKRYYGVLCYHFSQVAGTFDDTNEMDYFRKGNSSRFERKWNQVRARSPQIWYADFVIDEEKNLYKPEWTGKVSRRNIGTEEDNISIECPGCRFIYRKVNYKQCPKCYEKNNNDG